MLTHLRIENYALIRHLSIQWQDGFSVITGETGAGKSILLGALSLILGQRSDTQVLFDKNIKCYVEGTFYIKEYELQWLFEKYDLDYEDTLLLRREINPAGKSRAFINDTPVVLNVLKEFGEHLVNIHSQHETLELNMSGFQLNLVDDFAQQNTLLKTYREKYQDFLRKQNRLSSLMESEAKSKKDKDYFEFLFNELDDAKLNESEQSELEDELELLTHAEFIKTGLYNTLTVLYKNENNLSGKLKETVLVLENISKYHSEIASIHERLLSSWIEIKDIETEIERLDDKVNYDSERIAQINERLDVIYRLEQKHRVASVKELIELKYHYTKELELIGSLEEEIINCQKKLAEKEREIREIASNISKNRAKAIPVIEREVLTLLLSLGMLNAQFKIEQNKNKVLSINGIDNIYFLFNANRGGVLKEISKVASGGELSRLMLALKSLVSERKLLPTIIFDEIDMGVSGEVAAKVGIILQKMAKKMQVIAITHLPQIAGKSKNHYFVYKEDIGGVTNSTIKLLSHQERITEIAKMLSSEMITEAALETAKELMKN